MRIYYHLSDYISHRKAGEAYMRCLAFIGHDLVSSPDSADIAILHDDASNFSFHIARLRALQDIPKIGFCVWETDVLPEAYSRGLSLVDRVWTPSDFSHAAIEPYFPGTRVLPHIVERHRPGSDALNWAMARIGKQPGESVHYFYTVIDAINPRKNLEGLLHAFTLAFPSNGTRTDRARKEVRLVLKQYRSPRDVGMFKNVVSIDESLSDEHMAALHAVCDTFVSAHHAEGWGMALSEAMSFGRMVIATGYSGNMQFMNLDNSVPLPYTLVPVSRRMCDASPLFSESMHWADVSIPAMAEAMRVALHGVSAEKRLYIRESVRCFSFEAVSARMTQLLSEFS